MDWSVFEAPSPEEAYAIAPDPLIESAALMSYSNLLRTGEYGREREREYRLRHAALEDRMALAEIPETPEAHTAISHAARAALILWQWDKENPGDVAGPYGPTSIEWDPSIRPYVRQEYFAWLTGNSESSREGSKNA
ncbi:hypothetical protein [Streptomyces sp. NPDC053720]|uniref:hypothetical protein n=1 Tax=Streptomyces sp. NPDC053720 TaxID=3154855 RepID=UPI003418976C